MSHFCPMPRNAVWLPNQRHHYTHQRKCFARTFFCSFRSLLLSFVLFKHKNSSSIFNDPDSKNNAYERVFDDTFEALPDLLRDKDNIVLMGIAWYIDADLPSCIRYGGYDEEAFDKDRINAIIKIIYEGLPAGKCMVFEDVIEDPEESLGGGFGTSTCPIDLEDYCDWATMSTRSKEYVLLDFMSDRMDLMKPSWLYCGVRRRLVEKRREMMNAKEIRLVFNTHIWRLAFNAFNIKVHEAMCRF